MVVSCEMTLTYVLECVERQAVERNARCPNRGLPDYKTTWPGR
jgi:hypothetical protein